MNARVSVLAAAAALGAAPSAFALVPAVIVPSPQESTPGSTPIIYPVAGLPHPIEIEGLTLSNPSTTTTASSGGGTFVINSFFDVFTEISLDGGTTFTPSTLPHGANEMATGSAPPPSGGSTTYTDQMTALNILNLPLPGGGSADIRIDPGTPSTGQTTITDSGSFPAHSFFDVFTDISLDGGATWTPASNGAAVLSDSPEPASIGVLGLGVVALLRRRR